jgi:hypothetical protein
MKYFIKEKQLFTELKKFGFQSCDDAVMATINEFHQKSVANLLNKNKKGKNQKGGRISFPVEFFGGVSSHYTLDTPKFTDVSSSDTMLRQPLSLNDPTGVLGSEKAFAPLVGGKQDKQKHFLISNVASKEVLKHLLAEKPDLQVGNKKQFAEEAKQKFETSMTEVLTKAKKSNKSHSTHLTQVDIQKILEQKKYKSLKA